MIGSSFVQELPALFDQVQELGYAFSSAAVDVGALQRVKCEAFGAIFRERTLQTATVCEVSEELNVPVEDDSFPATKELVSQLAGLVRHSAESSEGLSDFHANEVTFMRYRGLGSGITPHKDSLRYHKLLLILSIDGAAEFRILDASDRRSTIEKRIVETGDITLLRGNCILDKADKRPVHSIGPPLSGERLALVMRKVVRE